MKSTELSILGKERKHVLYTIFNGAKSNSKKKGLRILQKDPSWERNKFSLKEKWAPFIQHDDFHLKQKISINSTNLGKLLPWSCLLAKYAFFCFGLK